MSVRRCVVLGAGGFIGAHLVKRLKRDGHWVRGVDLHYPQFAPTAADVFQIADLTDLLAVARACAGGVDTIYQLATSMGGAGFIFTGEHDAQVMMTGAQINLHVAKVATLEGAQVFFSSSACVYNQQLQEAIEAEPLRETAAYPAWPDSEYGWEKLFSERLYLAHARNYGLKVTLARFHSIVGPEGTWQGGKEKVFAALCRKIALVEDGGTIDMWGDGEQTRTFLDVAECVEGIERLVAAEVEGPVNLGSTTLISINDLAQLIANHAGKRVEINHIPGPLGVRGRSADLSLLEERTWWIPEEWLVKTIARTYDWIAQQIAEGKYVGAL